MGKIKRELMEFSLIPKEFDLLIKKGDKALVFSRIDGRDIDLIQTNKTENKFLFQILGFRTLVKNLKIHHDGLYYELPFHTRAMMVAYIFAVFFIAAYVKFPKEYNIEKIADSLKDEFEIFLLFTFSLFGVLKLVSDDQKIIKHTLQGVRVLKTSSQVRKAVYPLNVGIKAKTLLMTDEISAVYGANLCTVRKQNREGVIRDDSYVTRKELEEVGCIFLNSSVILPSKEEVATILSRGSVGYVDYSFANTGFLKNNFHDRFGTD